MTDIWVCGTCHSINRQRNAKCYKCGAKQDMSATGPLADRDYATLRAYTGAAPVTKRSGKRACFVHMRYACNTRLRQALYHWSRTSIQHDDAARAYYDGLRVRGHRHARALRSVADRWLRILTAMLKAGTVYDASRFVQPEAATV